MSDREQGEIDDLSEAANKLREIARRNDPDDVYAVMTAEEVSLINAVAWYLERQIPIPVSERPGDSRDAVLVFEAFRKRWYEGVLTANHEWVIVGHSIDSQYITHWLPMPPAPK